MAFFIACKKKNIGISCVLILNMALYHSQILLKLWLISNRTLCHPIWCVIILVIKQIGLRQVVVWFCQSLVWLQTELDSTQSCYHYKKLIDNIPGKITLSRNFKNNYAEICLVYFLWNIIGFLRPFFFWKFNFCPFQWGIALYETVNNSRDIIFKSCMVKNTLIVGEDNVILQSHNF